jgi:class 3 adenylate cyclase
MADLDTIIDHLNLQSFELAAFGGPAYAAITCAAEHHNRLSRLVLWSPGVNTLAYFGGAERFDAVMSLAERDWELATEAIAHALIGAVQGEWREAHLWAEFIRESLTQDDFLGWWRASRDMDVTHLLPEISAPTLVLQHPESHVDCSQLITSEVANAQLVRLAAGPLAPWEHDEVTLLIEEFLGIGSTPIEHLDRRSATAFHTILFTDVEGSTALTDRLGDDDAREVMREHERITREALKAHGGSEVKTMGDGFMASFGSATKALECAVAVQKAFDTPGTTVGAQGLAPLRPEAPIRVRIGLNAGEPIAEDDPDGRSDLFGTAVIVAARIAAQAHGGEILVSDVVRQLVAGKGFLFNDRGEQALRGFEDPVRVYEVQWRGSSGS